MLLLNWGFLILLCKKVLDGNIYLESSMSNVQTITKKDVTKRTAKLVGEKIYTTEKTVDGVFNGLRQYSEKTDPEI